MAAATMQFGFGTGGVAGAEGFFACRVSLRRVSKLNGGGPDHHDAIFACILVLL
jgi:hypothetical protein